MVMFSINGDVLAGHPSVIHRERCCRKTGNAAYNIRLAVFNAFVLPGMNAVIISHKDTSFQKLHFLRLTSEDGSIIMTQGLETQWLIFCKMRKKVQMCRKVS